MRHWLVTLTLAVVALPQVAEAEKFRVDQAQRAISATPQPPAAAREPHVTLLPPTIAVDDRALTIRTTRGQVRHTLWRRDRGLAWIAVVGPHVVVGFAARPGGTADSIAAIDHRTGRLAWRRSVDSRFATELVGHLLAVERAGTLDVLDARTGKTLGSAAITGRSIVSVTRPPAGDLYVKTPGELVAIDRTSGVVQWSQPSSSSGNSLVAASTVVDSWIDRRAHRFGLVSYDRQTGKRLDTIDLGPTSGWYDYEQVVIAPDGAHDVLVSAAFARE